MKKGTSDDTGPLLAQPLPSVEPAFDLAGLLDEFDASVFPALLSVAFEGLDDRDEDFVMMRSFQLDGSRSTVRTCVQARAEAMEPLESRSPPKTPQPRSAAFRARL